MGSGFFLTSLFRTYLVWKYLRFMSFEIRHTTLLHGTLFTAFHCILKNFLSCERVRVCVRWTIFFFYFGYVCMRISSYLISNSRRRVTTQRPIRSVPRGKKISNKNAIYGSHTTLNNCKAFIHTCGERCLTHITMCHWIDTRTRHPSIEKRHIILRDVLYVDYSKFYYIMLEFSSAACEKYHLILNIFHLVHFWVVFLTNVISVIIIVMIFQM